MFGVVAGASSHIRFLKVMNSASMNFSSHSSAASEYPDHVYMCMVSRDIRFILDPMPSNFIGLTLPALSSPGMNRC